MEGKSEGGKRGKVRESERARERERDKDSPNKRIQCSLFLILPPLFSEGGRGREKHPSRVSKCRVLQQFAPALFYMIPSLSPRHFP